TTSQAPLLSERSHQQAPPAWIPGCPPGRPRRRSVDLEDGHEGRLGDLDVADLLHALLAGLLLLEPLALARDVAAVAFGRDVRAEGADRLARDDLATDGRLDGDFELLARQDLLH